MYEWFLEYWTVILFYVGISLVIYLNRKKFDFEGIVMLYKTKFGIKAMQKYAKKYPRLISSLATMGIWTGWLGMIVIIAMVFYGIYQLIFFPQAPAMFTPVLPGFQVPGGPRIPLITGLLALFIVIVVHEFAHGVVSKLHKIKIKSSGFAMVGPIPAAFVEPDEKALNKASVKKQLGIYAAGPFSNVLLAILIVIIQLGLVLAVLPGFTADGLTVVSSEFNDNLTGIKIIGADNTNISTAGDLHNFLNQRNPGDEILLTSPEGNIPVTLQSHPTDNTSAYMGVTLQQEIGAKGPLLQTVKPVVFWFIGNPFSTNLTSSLGLLGWIYLLSLGIGLVNLLPLGPVDGGRMLLITLKKYMNEKLAEKIWYYTSVTLVAMLILLIFVPIIRNMF